MDLGSTDDPRTVWRILEQSVGKRGQREAGKPVWEVRHVDTNLLLIPRTCVEKETLEDYLSLLLLRQLTRLS